MSSRHTVPDAQPVSADPPSRSSRPFLRRAWIWIVAFIVLGAFALLYVMSDSRLVTAGATPGYRGAAQDTGYLADGYANGVGVAWQMNAADAGLDRIDDYAAADGRLFLVGYRGSQRVAIGYDASSAKPRELWRTNLTDDEPGSYWWEGDLLVGNTLVSVADGTTTTGWPTPTARFDHSSYSRPTLSGWTSAPVGSVRLNCPDPSTLQCEAWDKNVTRAWEFDASRGDFPTTDKPLEGWVPLRRTTYAIARVETRDAGALVGFLNVNTGERVGVDAINEACSPIEIRGLTEEDRCPLTGTGSFKVAIIRASDGWLIGDEDGNVATVAPDGSNAQLFPMSSEAIERLRYLETYSGTSQPTPPTTEELMTYASTGAHPWETTISLTPATSDSFNAAITINDRDPIVTSQSIFPSSRNSPETWWRRPAISRDTSVILLASIDQEKPHSQSKLPEARPLLLNVTAHEDAPAPASALNEYAVPAWNDYQATEAIPLFDDLIIARVTQGVSSARTPTTTSSDDHIVGLIPTTNTTRSTQ